MRKKAMVYLVRVLLQKIIGFSLYLVGAGFVLTYAGSIYFISLFAGTMIISLLLLKANEETLAQRGKTATSCIFREICASVPKERSAIPLGTERSSAGC